MNINTYLINSLHDKLWLYNAPENSIGSFLATPSKLNLRQKEAIAVIRDIMNAHGKQELVDTLIELARVEQKIIELDYWARDHVAHALLSFVLGIYLNEEFLGNLGLKTVDRFQWKLAGLFHDVAYPMEMALNSVAKPFTDTINKSIQRIGVKAQEVGCRLVPYNFENLKNGQNAFNLIQDQLNSWELKIDAKKAYEESVNSGQICHGMMSSLAVLFLVDLLYDRFNEKREYRDVYAQVSPQSGDINFNQIYFERDVVSACSAIYVHNLPYKWFVNAKIDRKKAPVAFLLKLADTLQEWERPTKDSRSGFLASQFDIWISDKTLEFLADIPTDRNKKMREDISSTLIAPDVKIH